MKQLKLLGFILLVITTLSCEKDEITGCTDSLSYSYNSEAESDDGSCAYYYGGREMGQLDVGAEIDLDNEFDIYFDGTLIGRLTYYFPNGLSCGEPNAVGKVVPSGSYLVRAVGNGGSEIREGVVTLSPQECKVILLENLPIVDTGGGGGNDSGSLIFYVNEDLGCGPISVNLSNVGNDTITGFYGSAPDCGASAGANFSNLDPGVYSYTASCSGINWNGTVTIEANTCLRQLLVGSGGGGGNDTGSLIFYVNEDLGCGPISVNLSNVGNDTITGYYGSAPDCGASAGANFSNLNPGVYSYTASCSGIDWSGTVTIEANTCSRQLLIGSGGGGGGGNGTGDVKFWINQDFGCGNISVNVSSVGSSTISGYFPTAPSCDNSAAGGNFNNLSPGNYSYNASCNGYTWQGSFTVTENQCLQFQLTI